MTQADVYRAMQQIKDADVSLGVDRFSVQPCSLADVFIAVASSSSPPQGSKARPTDVVVETFL